MNAKQILVGACSLLAWVGVNANAADINWGAARNITGDADVSTEGTSVLAASFCTAGDITVNGVTFSGGGSNAGMVKSSVYGDALDYQVSRNNNKAFRSGANPFSSLSNEYQTLLKSAVYNLAPRLTGDMTFNNLIPGQKYQVQIWVNDPRSSATVSYSALSMTVDGQVTLDMNVSDKGGGPGQFVIGTFIADDSGSQTFTLKTSVDSWMINALQLRIIPRSTETLGLIIASR